MTFVFMSLIIIKKFCQSVLGDDDNSEVLQNWALGKLKELWAFAPVSAGTYVCFSKCLPNVQVLFLHG